jgi:hypothetical protein
MRNPCKNIVVLTLLSWPDDPVAGSAGLGPFYTTPRKQISSCLAGVGVISISGVAERIDGDRPGASCDKTLDELRAAGQAFDLPR